VQVKFNIISVLQLSYLDLLFPSNKIIQNFLSFKKHRLFHLLALAHSGLGVDDDDVDNLQFPSASQPSPADRKDRFQFMSTGTINGLCHVLR
jgi:hypothetical protein